MPTQNTWRMKKYQALPYMVSDATDDAESTITEPTTFSTMTTATRSIAVDDPVVLAEAVCLRPR